MADDAPGDEVLAIRAAAARSIAREATARAY